MLFSSQLNPSNNPDGLKSSADRHVHKCFHCQPKNIPLFLIDIYDIYIYTLIQVLDLFVYLALWALVAKGYRTEGMVTNECI